MATKTAEDNQSQLWDREIESPELEAAIELIKEHELPADDRKELANARRVVKEITEQYDLEDGQRLRCGRYIITGKARAGGGFEVPTWSKTTVGTITEVEI